MNIEKLDKIDPQKYSLSSQIKLVLVFDNQIGIIKKRKSRIIMKDGEKILEIFDKIKEFEPLVEFSLITNAPICGKTRKFFAQKKISIIEIEE